MKKNKLLLVFFWLICTIGFAQNNEKTNPDTFLSNAVFNGLKKDKFPQILAKEILADKSAWFVMKCPICTPVSRAFEKYLPESDSKIKSKLSKSLIKRFKNKNKTERQWALRDLIDKYVQEHYRALQFNPEEKAKMEKELLADRKQGMGLKSDDFGKFCPSCDGATGKSKE